MRKGRLSECKCMCVCVFEERDRKVRDRVGKSGDEAKARSKKGRLTEDTYLAAPSIANGKKTPIRPDRVTRKRGGRTKHRATQRDLMKGTNQGECPKSRKSTYES